MLLLAQPILEKNNPNPHKTAQLAIVLVGHDASSELYVAIKQRQAAKYGVTVTIHRLPESAKQAEVESIIESLNTDSNVDALIVQLPLPNQIDTDTVLNKIAPKKDVDNLTGTGTFISPMVLSVQALIDYYQVDLIKKKLCVVGHGRLIGQPLAAWLQSLGYEAKIIEEETDKADIMIRQADVIFAGTGQKYRINDINTRETQLIFDCSGVDVDFEVVKDKCQAITPPKGSIGPLTVHFLFQNVMLTAKS